MHHEIPFGVDSWREKKTKQKTMLSNAPFSSIGKPCFTTPLGKPEMRAPRQMMGSS